MQDPRFTEEVIEIMFREKSRDYPGGRIALLSDGRVVFPEIRFMPEIGKKYSCRVRFYERGEAVIGIASPTETILSETEYLRDEQIILGVTFIRERNTFLARHPVSGAYIVPTDASKDAIKEGVQCWVMIVQRGTSLNAHFIKNVEGIEKTPTAGEAIVNYDASFAASAEQALMEKKGMGNTPVFFFQKKNRFPWEILGIERVAEMDEIRQAYRGLTVKFHPDQNPRANHEDFVALAHAHDWATFHRQWIDDISAKLKAQTAPVATTEVPTTTKKVVKKTTASKPSAPPAEFYRKLAPPITNCTEFPLDDKAAAKLAELKTELEAGKNGDQTIDCLALNGKQISRIKELGIIYLKDFMIQANDPTRLKCLADVTRISQKTLAKAIEKAQVELEQ